MEFPLRLIPKRVTSLRRPHYHTSLIASVYVFCLGLLCATVLAACDRGESNAAMATPSGLSKSLRGAADGELATSDSAAHWDSRQRALVAAQGTNDAIGARVYAIVNDAAFDAAWVIDAASRKASVR